MFEKMLEAADEIEAGLLVQESEADGLCQTAAYYEGLANGRGLAVALRALGREIGLHAEAMRIQLQILRDACAQHPSNPSNDRGSQAVRH